MKIVEVVCEIYGQRKFTVSADGKEYSCYLVKGMDNLAKVKTLKGEEVTYSKIGQKIVLACLNKAYKL